jgi:hypothetical protein
MTVARIPAMARLSHPSRFSFRCLALPWSASVTAESDEIAVVRSDAAFHLILIPCATACILGTQPSGRRVHAWVT